MEKILLPIHLVSLLYVLWNVLHADHLGFNWVRGKVATLNIETVRKYHRGTWTGLILMILTGSFLFWPLREYLFTRPQFFVKMGFVLALLVNSFAIGTLSKISTIRTYSSLSFKERLPLVLSGIISTFSWLGATACGFFIVAE